MPTAEAQPRPLTKRQQALAANLADPSIPTVKAAALASGYSPATCGSQSYKMAAKLGQAGHIQTAKLARLDKAMGMRALGERLLLAGAKETERLDPQAKLSVGAGLVKLALEMQHKYGLELDPDSGEALDSFRAWLLALQYNAAKYGSTERGQAWLASLARKLGHAEPHAVDAEVIPD